MKRSTIFIFGFVFIGLFKLSAQALTWSFHLDDMSFGMAAMADVDDDGLLEIAFSTYRNDERIIVLNAEDGSLLWDYHTGGCNDVAPLIYDVDLDGELEIVLPGSCNPKTFCFDARTGELEWVTNTHGSDSPPTVADLDNDGMPEILHGEFGGWVLCLNGEDGSVNWNILVDDNSWIQTAPTILDVDLDGQLDFVIANWNFDDDHRIFAFRGDNHELLWVSDEPEGVMYHGASHADLDGDGFEELVIGDYSGKLMVLEAESGELAWSFRFPDSYSISAPTAIADLDNDGELEIIFIDWYQLGVLDKQGNLEWQYDIPDFASSFRGCAISDMNGDELLDLIFATSDGKVYFIEGYNGELIDALDIHDYFDLPEFEFNHGPLIGDFDGNNKQDVFVVGGEAQYPGEEDNYGIAMSLEINGSGGPDWPMFRRDVRRTACVCDEVANTNLNTMLDSDPKLFFDLKDQHLKVLKPDGRKYKVKIYDLEGRHIESCWIQDQARLMTSTSGFYFYELFYKSKRVGQGKLFLY